MTELAAAIAVAGAALAAAFGNQSSYRKNNWINDTPTRNEQWITFNNVRWGSLNRSDAYLRSINRFNPSFHQIINLFDKFVEKEGWWMFQYMLTVSTVLGDTLVVLISIILLLFLVKYFAWDKIEAMLEARRQKN